MKPIPYGRQDILEVDVQAVLERLQSDWLTTGPAVEDFEKQVADYSGARYGIAVNSATSALHIACMVLELGQGDVLWTSPNTFVASANCALYCGAAVDFVDIDPQTYNMSPQALQVKLEQAAKVGKLPKVIVPVHFSGQLCDMPSIGALAKQYGVAVIEDASHAIGAEWEGKKVGDCRYSDMTVFSFHPVKIITTAEGGMVLTQKEELAEKLRLCRAHGITREKSRMTEVAHGPWYYQQIDIGFNYRLTDIQCALGLSQLQRIDAFLARRRVIAAQYDCALSALPLIRPFQREESLSAWHLYVIQVDEEKAGYSRLQAVQKLHAAGILVNVHYIPVHTQPAYRQRFGFDWGDFPVAEHYYQRAISLPMYAGLSDDQQKRVIEVLHEL